MFVGVDGWKQGWVAIVVNTRRFVEARSFGSFDALMAWAAEAKVVGVDMPIGLVDAPSRFADVEARAFLVGQASSVFNAPPRSALKAKSHAQASEISRRVADKGLSQQSYALFDKIREVDEHEGNARIHEVHPEVGFRIMNGAVALPSKKTWGGMQARLSLLAGEGIVLPASLGEADAVIIDDVIDAAAAAWTARRIGKGKAQRLAGESEQRTGSGRVIAIWG